MRHGGGFRVLAALVLVGVIAALTAGAYGAGFAAGSTSGATNVSPWVYGGAFGAGHVIGFFVTVLVLIVLFRVLVFAFVGHRHPWWGRRGYWRGGSEGTMPADGPGGWHRGEWRDAAQATFDDYHNRAHATPPASTGGDPNKPAAS
ncbi:MAG: hypothetical protein ABSE58_03055 [Candidatus Limnocylindrales bacterium]|jgi:hypothetical protein